MTEAEFDKRLSQLIAARVSSDKGMSGILDSIFDGVKTAVSYVGNGIGSAFSGIASGIGSAITSVSSGAGASLLQTALTAGAGIYATKQAAGVQKDIAQLQIQAQQQAQQQQLNAALQAQGVSMTSQPAQQLVRDVVATGVVGADGKVIYPSVVQQSQGITAGTMLGGLSITTWLTILGGFFALAVVLPSATGKK